MKLCYHCMHQIKDENIYTCPACGRSLAPQPVGAKYLQPGTVLQGKFIVGYPLGAGGFGNTYIGWNRVLFCKVAIKEFYPEQYCYRAADRATVSVSDEKQEDRFRIGLRQFLEEARNVAALQDIPGVVEISSFFEENMTGYIVMEYLEGMDVKAILAKSGGKMDYGWCRRVVLTVLYTLREVHRRGVLHRDIAPDNVFMTREGIIKLIDFGAAKHISALSNASPEIVLKVGYAPIEQYSREAPQGPYTDLYAVAALFYRMLTGQRPIPANERSGTDGLIPPSDMGIKIPRQAEMGMMVCLNVQPQYRLQSVDEFMEALAGKDFVPVYEPEWIFPVTEEGQGIKEKIARIPIPAWIGLCLGCICLIGVTIFGAARLRERGAGGTGLVNGAIVMNDLTGMTEEEAAASIEELERRAREEGVILDIELETDGYIFDLDRDKDGTVAAQTVKPFAVLYDPEAESQEELEGLERDEDGNVSGTVVCSLYSNTKLYYRDLRGLNIYAMARKLGIDPGDEEHFIGTDEVEGSSYSDLIRLETPDGEITAQELKKKKNRKKEIAYAADGMRIVYSDIPFFYWETLPDLKQVYGTLDKIPAQETYILKNEDERESSGQKKRLEEAGGMVDKTYCAISASESSKGFHKGDIIEQTYPAGGELDTSRTRLDRALLCAIGEEVFYSGKSGERFKNELAERWGETVNVVAKGSGVMTQPVLSVTVTGADGTAVDYFKKGDAVTVTLDLASVSTPTPIPTPMPTQQAPSLAEGGTGAGSPAGGNIGGGYAGGGSTGGSGLGGGGGQSEGFGDDPGDGDSASTPEPAAPAPAVPAPAAPEPVVPDAGGGGYMDGVVPGGGSTGGSTGGTDPGGLIF